MTSGDGCSAARVLAAETEDPDCGDGVADTGEMLARARRRGGYASEAASACQAGSSA